MQDGIPAMTAGGMSARGNRIQSVSEWAAGGKRLCRQKGVKTIVWFEPERVMPNSKVYQEHPSGC